jgi:hypothetical protein
MDREHSPLRSDRRLTLELFDYYVAQARAERAKAIAEFGGHVAAWLSRIVGRLARHRRPARPLHRLPTPRRRPVS